MNTQILIDILKSISGTTFVMFIGPPGSGKSFLAKDIRLQCINYRTISSDELRKTMLGDANDQSNNPMVFAEAHRIAVDNLKMNNSIIFDATNCRQFYRRKTIKEIRPYCDTIIGVIFTTPLDKCLNRNFSREDHSVPDKVIETMHKSLYTNFPKIEEGFDMLIKF